MLCNSIFTQLKIQRGLKDFFKEGNKRKISEMSNLPFQNLSPNTHTHIDIEIDIKHRYQDIYSFKRRKNMFLDDSEI